MIEWLNFSSKAIRGFPMGDPHERSFPVYLPPGFTAASKEKYPVVFFLAGYSAKGATYLTDDSAFGTPLPKRFDLAIQDGRLRPFIGVFPDCTSKLGHSQYVNSPAFGNYMDYLCDELVPFIDEKYPTYRHADYRVLVGHSSGGFGTLVTGMIRPEVFHWLSASASDSFYEVLMAAHVNRALIETHKAGGVKPFVENVLAKPGPRNIGGAEFDAMIILAMAPCYAPNINNPPLYGDVFFDLDTGEFHPEIWKKYLAWDPVKMVDHYSESLKKLKFVQLEAGMQDEHGLQWGHRQIAKKLKSYGVPFEINEYPGAHGGHHWRYESRLTRLLDRMF